MIQATRKRFERFNKLRDNQESHEIFWDVVVLTAVDKSQKEAYESQLKAKLDNHQLPLSTKYVVVADPPNLKIGNGGSTLLVLKTLHDMLGDEFTRKRTIIIHAGGYSQRLPNASVMGKVFMPIPSNNPCYEMLELKLASYIDFPSRIEGGGVFVCCSDTLEAYNDADVSWTFPHTGITALAHPSPLEVGETHGVFVLEGASESLLRRCKQYLHKPPISVMRATDGCVQESNHGPSSSHFVLSDSAYFMAADVCLKLLNFHDKHNPFTCEIDAYGDFLQSLGTEASSDFVRNVVNVVEAADGLIAVRRDVFDCLHGLDFHALVLAPTCAVTKDVESRFFHFGTTNEYLSLFTEDKSLMDILTVNMVSQCSGLPFQYIPDELAETAQHGSAVPENVVGLMGSAASGKSLRVLPCVMHSLVYPGVRLAERSIIEYSTVRECVTMGRNCIISHCSIGQRASIPANTFAHTVPICADKVGCPYNSGYCTVLFGVNDNLKASASISQLYYMDKKLCDVFSDSERLSADNGSVRLWHVKLFRVFPTAEESFADANQFLDKLNSGKEAQNEVGPHLRLSMADVLAAKDVGRMLKYRQAMKQRVNKSKTDESFLPDLEGFVNKEFSSNIAA